MMSLVSVGVVYAPCDHDITSPTHVIHSFRHGLSESECAGDFGGNHGGATDIRYIMERN